MVRYRCGLGCLILLLASAQAVRSQTEPAAATGSVCVLPYVKLTGDVHRQSPDVPPPAKHYTLRLDGGAWIPLSSEASRALIDIPAVGRHKVVIRGDGKPFVAFSFSFAQYGSTELCLMQREMYKDWVMTQAKRSFKSCQCKGVEPASWAPGPQ